MSDKDPYIGEVFEDKDWRMSERRVKVLSKFLKKDGWGGEYEAYRVETVSAPANPTSVGNKSSVSAALLLKRYRKVSH